MINSVSRFYDLIEKTGDTSATNVIACFIYYLTIMRGYDSVSVRDVRQCYIECAVPAPANMYYHFSRGLKSRTKKYIKKNGGYQLTRDMRNVVVRTLGIKEKDVTTQASINVETKKLLNNLEQKTPDGNEKEFLKETIRCYEMRANRATIIMLWIFTLEHFFSYILKHKLKEFNEKVYEGSGKKIKKVTKHDDFSEMKEKTFIKICRTAKIISSSVQKILDNNLGIRNSCAHPSGIKIKDSKVDLVVDDLVENVINKYKI